MNKEREQRLKRIAAVYPKAAAEARLTDRPEPGKIYALTGGPDTPALSNGNTWAESEVIDPPEYVNPQRVTVSNDEYMVTGIDRDQVDAHWHEYGGACHDKHEGPPKFYIVRAPAHTTDYVYLHEGEVEDWGDGEYLGYIDEEISEDAPEQIIAGPFATREEALASDAAWTEG